MRALNKRITTREKSFIAQLWKDHQWATSQEIADLAMANGVRCKSGQAQDQYPFECDPNICTVRMQQAVRAVKAYPHLRPTALERVVGISDNSIAKAQQYINEGVIPPTKRKPKPILTPHPIAESITALMAEVSAAEPVVEPDKYTELRGAANAATLETRLHTIEKWLVDTEEWIVYTKAYMQGQTEGINKLNDAVKKLWAMQPDEPTMQDKLRADGNNEAADAMDDMKAEIRRLEGE